ncbi:hypothetical protein ColTof4_01089 [Colletotrichum tofieldiae]|nr:hypothetical protein ColTof3_08311 [Colletotrichum tofieldiae]GKT68666.1 hypothetical protein ColTof4_01089 [Colletotrichum tofieldiae]GKT96705.1 hypothetical protein Ct61P_14555 [Colletotrichum tofieldiae]
MFIHVSVSVSILMQAFIFGSLLLNNEAVWLLSPQAFGLTKPPPLGLSIEICHQMLLSLQRFRLSADAGYRADGMRLEEVV